MITQYPERHTHLPSFSRSSLTIIEAISADGSVLPPCIILPGKALMEDWFTHTNMPESWGTTTSPTGYSSDELALDWIHHFNIYSKKWQVRSIIYSYTKLFTIPSLTSFFLLDWQLSTPYNG